MFKKIAWLSVLSVTFVPNMQSTKSVFIEIIEEQDFLTEQGRLVLTPEEKEKIKKDYEEFVRTGKCLNCSLQYTRLSSAVRKIEKRCEHKPIILDGSDISHADATKIYLDDQAYLEGVKAHGTCFARAVMRNVSAKGADFQGSDFSLADCSKGDFRGADLSNIILPSSFSESNLSEASLKNARISEQWNFCAFDGAQLQGADVSGMNISNTDLHYAWGLGTVRGISSEDREKLLATKYYMCALQPGMSVESSMQYCLHGTLESCEEYLLRARHAAQNAQQKK